MDDKLSLLEENKAQLETIDKRVTEIEKNWVYKQDDEILLDTDRGAVNPWLEASLNRLHAVESEKYVLQSQKTLQSTIKVLSETEKGLDAEAVSKLTGKERNTESYYLNKLSRMGLVNKRRLGRKVIYKINKEMIEQIQSMFQ